MIKFTGPTFSQPPACMTIEIGKSVPPLGPDDLKHKPYLYRYLILPRQSTPEYYYSVSHIPQETRWRWDRGCWYLSFRHIWAPVIVQARIFSATTPEIRNPVQIFVWDFEIPREIPKSLWNHEIPKYLAKSLLRNPEISSEIPKSLCWNPEIVTKNYWKSLEIPKSQMKSRNPSQFTKSLVKSLLNPSRKPEILSLTKSRNLCEIQKSCKLFKEW